MKVRILPAPLMSYKPAHFSQYGLTFTTTTISLYGVLIVRLKSGQLFYKDTEWISTSQMYTNSLIFFKTIQGLDNEILHYGLTGLIALYWDELRKTYILNDYPAKFLIRLKDLRPL